MKLLKMVDNKVAPQTEHDTIKVQWNIQIQKNTNISSE